MTNDAKSAYDRWTDDLRFYVPSNSISVLSGKCEGDKEKLCEMEYRLWFESFPPAAELEPGTARSVGGILNSVW